MSLLAKRLRLSTALFSVWSITVLGLLAKLGGECPVAGNALIADESRGWTLHYVLSSDRAGHDLIRHLIARGQVPDLGAEISMKDPASWTEQLTNAGWALTKTSSGNSSASVSRLEILDPQRVVAWSGPLPANELSVPGAELLDVQLLARVVRGQSVPPLVPVGCAPSK